MGARYRFLFLKLSNLFSSLITLILRAFFSYENLPGTCPQPQFAKWSPTPTFLMSGWSSGAWIKNDIIQPFIGHMTEPIGHLSDRAYRSLDCVMIPQKINIGGDNGKKIMRAVCAEQ